MACLRPIKVGRDVYPCGKCTECIKLKQVDYAQLMFMQATRKGSAHFVTFTYDDNRLPIRSLDIQSGEMSFCNEVLRKEYFNLIPWDNALQCHKYKHVTLKDNPLFLMCATLRRKDWRDWHKRVRISFYRKFKQTLPDYTYLCVGEYGEKSYRPHYHALFFGLTDRQIHYMCDDWNKSFGFSLIKKLNACSNQDVAKVSMYVAKYLNKGCSDCPDLFINPTLMEKPRLMLSRGLAYREGTLSLLTLDGIIGLTDNVFYVSELTRILERMKFTFGNNEYILGRHFYLSALQIPNETFCEPLYGRNGEKVYYQIKYEIDSVDNEKIKIKPKKCEPSKTRFIASPLQLALTYLLRARINERNFQAQQLEIHTWNNSPHLLQVYRDFADYENYIQDSKEATSKQKRFRDVRKSIF